MSLNESIVEDAALTWFGELGYAVGHGPQLAPGEYAGGTLTPALSHGERESYGEVVLVGRLREAIRRLNPAIPEEAREEALLKVLRVATTSLVQTNRAFHRMLRDGIPVEFIQPEPSPQPSPSGRGRSEAEGEGQRRWSIVRLIDFDDVRANDWFAVNQFTVIEAGHNRRPDVVVFVNGLPLALIELKNAADEDATIWNAYAQLQTYKAEIPSLLHYNEVLVVSDGLQARMGSLTANQEWFKVWREIDSDSLPPSPHPSPRGRGSKATLELQTLIHGVFDRQRFLDLLQHFIVFEEDADTGALHKIIAGYHQFHAVNAAVEETVRASGMIEDGMVRETPGVSWSGKMHGGKPGDRRAGVVWHTQGSGKSFTMLFFAARVIRESVMQNPTLVVLTDRNDLDDQLFGQFQRCHDILGQMPVQAESREHLAELLKRASGGVVFTTIHKFATLTPSSPALLPEGEGRHFRGGFNFSGLKERAREMRKKQTESEEFLWALLRNRQLNGAKFRRQHQFGEYVCDFFCAEVKLAVECDGAVHLTVEAAAHDKQRDAYLKSQGVTVLRFENRVVIEETETVLEAICSHLPSTSGRGAGGEGNVAPTGRMETLSNRRNIIVIADEAHRSQYGFGGRVNEKGEMSYGFASNLRDALPNASFIGFTGTPIEKTDANTRTVFGDYI